MLHLFMIFLCESTLALMPPQAKSTVTARPISLLHNSTALKVNSTVERNGKRRKRTKQSVEKSASHAAPVERKAANTDTLHKVETKRSSKPKREVGGRESACLRRIKREWRDAVHLGIAYDWMKMQTLGTPSDKFSHVRIGPVGKNLLRWHFSVMGPPNSEYQGGIYHGRVLLPKNYPGSPPRIQVLTPSGRFIVGADICLSASSFHPESWTPRWTVLSLVEALRIHMLTTAQEIGGKDDTPEQRRQYARASRRWQLGRIDHGLMVRDGIFPWEGDEKETTVEEPVHATRDQDSGVQVAVRRTREARARQRVPQKTTLPTILIRAVVEVLTSPARLAALLVLTVFLILNRRR